MSRQSSSATAPLPPAVVCCALQHDGSWTSRVNYITLVENALSGAKDVKDTCTCTGLYVATVRAKKPIKHVEEEEEEQEEEGDETEYAKLMGGKVGLCVPAVAVSCSGKGPGIRDQSARSHQGLIVRVCLNHLNNLNHQP